MDKFLRWNVVFGTVIGFLVLWFTPVTGYQEPAQQQAPGPQKNISDQELRSFAKAYVEIRKIRLTYQSSLENVQDPKERQKIQQEGDSKIENALEEEGLKPETYNRIFTAANSDDELRKKILKMIEEEHDK